MILSFVLAACSLDPSALPVAQAPPGVHENFLLVILDDMGVDQADAWQLGTHTRPQLPAMDALSARGVRFSQAWASPTCSPTRASVLTGRAPYEHGVGAQLAPRQDGLDPALDTLPELLTGHTSALFGKWHLGSGAWSALDHGFAEHQGSLDGSVSPSYYDWDRYEASSDTTTTIDATTQPTAEDAYATFHAVDDAETWIAAHAASPWFVTVSFQAGHWARATGGVELYEAPPYARCGITATAVTTDAELYRKMLECADRELIRLLTDLYRAGELEDTTVIVMGDNGTDRTPDGFFSAAHRKGTVYQGGVHVPLVITDGYRLVHNRTNPNPGAFSSVGGVVRDAPVHVMDILPTIADIAGVTPTSTLPWARSLRAQLTSRRAPSVNPHDYVYTETFETVAGHMASCRQAVRHGRPVGGAMYKLIRAWRAGQPVDELYDAADEAEATDLAADPALQATLADLQAQLPHDCDVF
jgi:arylsulfatase A-like enzyme